jgi:hypothetical protein
MTCKDSVGLRARTILNLHHWLCGKRWFPALETSEELRLSFLVAHK